MVRCGELCGACGLQCGGLDGAFLIACVQCNETGRIGGEICEECDGEGYVQINECPREMVGSEMVDAINVAGMCSNGLLPVTGGLLDQSAWFLSLLESLNSETARIEAERLES